MTLDHLLFLVMSLIWGTTWIFIKVGLSFGAGTGMSAVLQDELVRKREAMPRGEFMALFGLARLVPSGSTTALTVAVGYRYQGWAGTLVALAAMILPGLHFVAVTALAMVRGEFRAKA